MISINFYEYKPASYILEKIGSHSLLDTPFCSFNASFEIKTICVVHHVYSNKAK